MHRYIPSITPKNPKKASSSANSKEKTKAVASSSGKSLPPTNTFHPNFLTTAEITKAKRQLHASILEYFSKLAALAYISTYT